LQAREVISLEELRDNKYGKVLCYPRCVQQELIRRLKELKSLRVQALEFIGETRLFDLRVLGKGYVGIVVVAHMTLGRAALKIRRTDADRKDMFHEAEMLKRANKVDVGPKLFEISENFLLMELFEGKNFPEWLESLDSKKGPTRARRVLNKILKQCYKLDKIQLDHGELSNAYKHIIVDADDKPHLIDFETASINRRASNVTAVCQYLFLGSQIAHRIRKKLEKADEKLLINALRGYKRKGTREKFEKILETIL